MESKIARPQAIQPPDRILKRVCFIVNNMTGFNLRRQAEEIASIMPKHFTQWLAESILKRVASEPHLHELYEEFVQMASAQFPTFETSILEILTREIDHMLSLPRIEPLGAKALKHLGSFLGRLTLAKDIHLCVDLRALIRKAYTRNPASLDYIIPFIAETIKTTRASRSLKPSEPWVNGVLQVLKELHDETDKLQLQFEVELLFTYLECDMQSITSSVFLRCQK